MSDELTRRRQWGEAMEERWGETTAALSREPDVAGKGEAETEIYGTILGHAVVSVSRPSFCIISGAGGGEESSRLVMKPNKAIIVLQGRYAGRKAVIIISFNEGTRDRSYGHCLVAGISKYPKKVIRKVSAKKKMKKSRVKAFIKLVNYNHIMPLVTLIIAAKEVKVRFEERFKIGKKGGSSPSSDSDRILGFVFQF